MTRAVLVLTSLEVRRKATAWIAKLPMNTRVEFKEPKRSLPQNDRMWLYLTVIAQALEWHGLKYSADDWKDYFMHALKRARWMPSEDGGFVPIGMRSSDLSKQEFSDLLEIIQEFASRHGVAPPEMERVA